MENEEKDGSEHGLDRHHSTIAYVGVGQDKSGRGEVLATREITWEISTLIILERIVQTIYQLGLAFKKHCAICSMPPTKTGKLPEAPEPGRILWLIAGPRTEAWPTL